MVASSRNRGTCHRIQQVTSVGVAQRDCHCAWIRECVWRSVQGGRRTRPWPPAVFQCVPAETGSALRLPVDDAAAAGREPAGKRQVHNTQHSVPGRPGHARHGWAAHESNALLRRCHPLQIPPNCSGRYPARPLYIATPSPPNSATTACLPACLPALSVARDSQVSQLLSTASKGKPTTKLARSIAHSPGGAESSRARSESASQAQPCARS
jgi:hypothetical protein